MIPQPSQPLTAEELQHLAELREVCNTADSPGWMHVLKQVQKWVDEAHEDMVGAKPGDTDRTKANLLDRWQQREAIKRGILQYAQDCQDQKQMLLEQITLERSSGEDEDAERYQEVG